MSTRTYFNSTGRPIRMVGVSELPVDAKSPLMDFDAAARTKAEIRDYLDEELPKDTILHRLLRRHPTEGRVPIPTRMRHWSEEYCELQLAADRPGLKLTELRPTRMVEVAVERIRDVGSREVDLETSQAAVYMTGDGLTARDVRNVVEDWKRRLGAAEMGPLYQAVEAKARAAATPRERKDAAMEYIDVISRDYNLYSLLTERPLTEKDPGWGRLEVDLKPQGSKADYTSTYYRLVVTPRPVLSDEDPAILEVRFLRVRETPQPSGRTMEEMPSREAGVVEMMNTTGNNVLDVKAAVDWAWHAKWEASVKLRAA